MRDLRFVGYGESLSSDGKLPSAVVSVHSDTKGFGLVAQVMASRGSEETDLLHVMGCGRGWLHHRKIYVVVSSRER